MVEPKAHSKFSASGMTRWQACPGSIKLSEGLPDKSSPAAEEGTRAHEVLEALLKDLSIPHSDRQMYIFAKQAADHILGLRAKRRGSKLLVESKVKLDFIHPEAFGTLDAAVVEYFGHLDILDFKYGMSFVSPVENLQFIFYALGVAHAYDWNFQTVRLWTLQPRVVGFDGFVFWDLTISELRKYIPIFELAVERVEKFPDQLVEGRHCYFCKAKSICPLKRDKGLATFQQALIDLETL